MDTGARPRAALKPAALCAVIFFCVSGGPYGLEPVLNLLGPWNAILLVLLTPLLWALPVILMVLELGGMMPAGGGYYRWVSEGLGPMWGFFEGWWSWLYQFVDLALYPVLFIQYIAFFFPVAAPLRYPLCLAIVWVCTALNLLGILPVGRTSAAFGAAVVLPFALLFAAALGSGHSSPVPEAARAVPSLPALGMGLFTVMWNYLGWDNATTFAPEVHRPERSYLVATGWALALILLTYTMAVVAAVRSGISPPLLERDGFPALGVLLGGPALGGLLSAGGMASALGLFVANLLSVSRLPKAMADDGALPALLRRTDARRGTPYASILVCALIVSGMVLWEFEDLLVIDVVLYGSGLFLEFLALISLRRLRPDARRPFRIPLGRKGLIAMTSLPALCFIAAIGGLSATRNIHTLALTFAILSVCTAPVAWSIARRSRLSGESGK
ncbi:MAG TPA: APC family permease [Bacteroidota bacterium]|nr:APC family permease [Bacteroidota bacterium]